MISYSYATDTPTKANELANTIIAALSPPQISAACVAVEAFLNNHTPDQTRWFFSVTFPTLICKIFGFNDSSSSSSAPKPLSPNGWIDIATSTNDSELAGRIFSLLSPHGVLLSSVSAVDRLSLVKYVFPVERLPEWVRYMLQNERDSRTLADLCPLFKNRLKEDSVKGSVFQVQLNVFEYFMFWFAYYPVCRVNNEGSEAPRVVEKSKKSKLEKWAYSIPRLSSTKQGTDQKNEGNLYIRLLYAYLRAYVPVHDLYVHQPYRSSLLHYSSGYDSTVIERAEFLVNALIHFWLVDNDFSPVPVSVCKSYGVVFPFRSILGETPPTSGLGDVVIMFVKYLNLNTLDVTQGSNQVEYIESPRRKALTSVDVVNPRDAPLSMQHSVNAWNSWIQRPLYRFILRALVLCPVESSIKNVSQMFTVWINYMEPWKISLEEFAELDTNTKSSTKHRQKEAAQSVTCGYSSYWQDYVLANYLYYSSLVMHFIGFAHKFLHTDPEAMIQMVSKVINILTSSKELMELVKNVDIVYHSKPAGPSKSMLNTLYRFVPSIREQLQDWEDGLCESDADGSFLHENWNKDLRLFSDSEDGGQQLLQLFVLRAKSELQAISGNNLAQNLKRLKSLETQLNALYGGCIKKRISGIAEASPGQHSSDEIFAPRRFGKSRMVGDIKYKDDYMERAVCDDEIAWLAKLLVKVSGWLNEWLGLNEARSNEEGPSWSYVELSSDGNSVSGALDIMKLVVFSFVSVVAMLGGAGVKLMRKHDIKVNLRMLASKKVVMIVVAIAALGLVRRALS